jgi:hypothetical protein
MIWKLFNRKKINAFKNSVMVGDTLMDDRCNEWIVTVKSKNGMKVEGVISAGIITAMYTGYVTWADAARNMHKVSLGDEVEDALRNVHTKV